MAKEEKIIGGKTYWNAEKAAEYVGLSRYTLLDRTRKKDITRLNLSGQFWFLKEWLDTFLNRSIVIGNRH